VRASIPVMGHIGLTPQSVHKMAGTWFRGATKTPARKLLRRAVALEAAAASRSCSRACARAREGDHCASHDSTIGNGAGKHCDGQVLVCYEPLGMNPDFKPKVREALTPTGFRHGEGGRGEVLRIGARTQLPRRRPQLPLEHDAAGRLEPDVVPDEREDKEKSGIYGVRFDA